MVFSQIRYLFFVNWNMQTVETQLPGLWSHVGVRPGCEKISLGGIVPGEHYTMIWKQGERKIDIHITYDDTSKEQEQVFEISFFAANRVLVQLKQIEALYRAYFGGRITTIPKLAEKHEDWLLHPLTGFGDEITEWLKIKEREISVRKSMRNNVKATFLNPSEAAFYEGCHWQVYDAKNLWRGFLFQKEKTGAIPEFIYVSKYRHDQFKREVQKLMNSIFSEVKYFCKYDLI